MKKFMVIDALGQLQIFNGDFDGKDKEAEIPVYRLMPREAITIEAENEEKLPKEILLAKKRGFVYITEAEQASKNSVKAKAETSKEAK